jgi:endonuclease YncB( thermonuclease family)
MKYRSILLVLTLLSALSHSTLGQRRTAGTVAELVDGKTVIVALSTGKVTVELPYIDVPEQGQPLYQTVRDHLQNLIVGKQVSFRLGGFVGSRMVGELQLNGADIGQQMLRDGAAWHVPPEKSGQGAADATVYSEAETAARNEKLGVWSVAGLKAPWIIREETLAEKIRAELAEKQKAEATEKEAQAKAVAAVKPKKAAPEVDQQTSNDAWLDVTLDKSKQPYGLYPFSSNVEGMPVGVISTSPEIVYLFSGTSRQKIACRVAYAEVQTPEGKYESIAVLGFQSISESLTLTKNKNSLSIFADGLRIPVSGLIDIFKREYFGVDERFAYSIKKGDFAKLANAKSVEIRIDNYKGKLAPTSLALFKQLAYVMQ